MSISVECNILNFERIDFISNISKIDDKLAELIDALVTNNGMNLSSLTLVGHGLGKKKYPNI